MTRFIFNEYNETLFHLPILTQMNLEPSAYLGYKDSKARRKEGNVKVKFEDKKGWEGTQIPCNEQLNTLQYLLDNQEEMLNSFFQYTKNVLYPTHIEYIGNDEISFPELNTLEDLRMALACLLYTSRCV